MIDLEKRVLNQIKVEMRKAGEDGEQEQRFVRGTGIVYDTEVEIWPGYMEKVRAGAFDESLKSDLEVKSYFNHNANFVLSTTQSNPALTIEDKSDGLIFDSPIPPTTYGEDLAVNLERGNVKGASFSFSVEEDILVIDENDVYHREIVKATLYEVGPVTNPAYPQTEVGVRSLEASFDDVKKRCKKDYEAPITTRSDNELELAKVRLKIVELG